MGADLFAYEEEVEIIQRVVEDLRAGARAEAVFLLERSGQQIALAGSLNGTDPTSIASLLAGSMAATDAIAGMLGEEHFQDFCQEGRRRNLQVSMILDRFILAVLFGDASSLGLVRLRVRQAATELAGILEKLPSEPATVADLDFWADDKGPSESQAFEITDEEIERLFQ